MMPLAKGFICIGDPLNKPNTNYFIISLGIIGSLVTLFGLSQNPAELYYVCGSTLLFITALYFRLFFFIALEIILIAGHGAILLGIGSILQIALPILLCVQLLIFYYLSNQLTNVFILTGISGIAVLSIGFSYENQWVFFIGSSAVAIYAFYAATKSKVALLWAILNTLFAIIAIAKISLT